MHSATRTSSVAKLKGAAVAALAVFALALTGCASEDSPSNDDNNGSNTSTTETTQRSTETTETTSRNNGNEETEATFTMSQAGVEMTLVYYAVGDDVVRQTTRNVINYAEAGFADDDAARAAIEPFLADFQGVDGLTHNMEYRGTEAIETLEVDYNVADLQEIAQLTGSTFEGDLSSGKLSMEQSRRMLLAAGWTEVD